MFHEGCHIWATCNGHFIKSFALISKDVPPRVCHYWRLAGCKRSKAGSHQLLLSALDTPCNPALSNDMRPCRWDGQQRYDDLWRLDCSTWQWQLLQPSGTHTLDDSGACVVHVLMQSGSWSKNSRDQSREEGAIKKRFSWLSHFTKIATAS